MTDLWQPPAGTLAFDTSAHVNQSQAEQLYAMGLRLALRYVLCPGGAIVPQPLTPEEVRWLRGSGLALGIVQGIQQADHINQAQGTTDGEAAAAAAEALGFPAGAVVWCDMEGAYHDKAELIAYLNAWGHAVKAGGYACGLYNGPQSLLNAAEIQALVFPHFWQSGARCPTPSRGYQMIQLNPSNLPAAGTAIDLDVVQRDYFGSWASFWAAAPLHAAKLAGAAPAAAESSSSGDELARGVNGSSLDDYAGDEDSCTDEGLSEENATDPPAAGIPKKRRKKR